MQRLSSADVIFASPQATRFNSAEKTFRKAIAGESSTGGLDIGRLSQYFSARKAFEEKHYQEFDQTRLDELRKTSRSSVECNTSTYIASGLLAETLRLVVSSPRE